MIFHFWSKTGICRICSMTAVSRDFFPASRIKKDEQGKKKKKARDRQGKVKDLASGQKTHFYLGLALAVLILFFFFYIGLSTQYERFSSRLAWNAKGICFRMARNLGDFIAYLERLAEVNLTERHRGRWTIFLHDDQPSLNKGLRGEDVFDRVERMESWLR
jgi:hypothetical protein